MPTLRDPRHEAFAQARAKGTLLIDAYESAGFVRHRGHPSRLAWKTEVANRIAELRASQTEAEDTTPQVLLASLRREAAAAAAPERVAQRPSPPRQALSSAPRTPRKRPARS